MPRQTTPSQRRGSQIAQAYRNAHEVVSACMGLALLTGGGFWLDKRFGWSPLFTICGAVLGSITAAASLRRLLKRLDRESRREQLLRTKQEDPPGQNEGGLR